MDKMIVVIIIVVVVVMLPRTMMRKIIMSKHAPARRNASQRNHSLARTTRRCRSQCNRQGRTNALANGRQTQFAIRGRHFDSPRRGKSQYRQRQAWQIYHPALCLSTSVLGNGQSVGPTWRCATSGQEYTLCVFLWRLKWPSNTKTRVVWTSHLSSHDGRLGIGSVIWHEKGQFARRGSLREGAL